MKQFLGQPVIAWAQLSAVLVISFALFAVHYDHTRMFPGPNCSDGHVARPRSAHCVFELKQPVSCPTPLLCTVNVVTSEDCKTLPNQCTGGKPLMAKLLDMTEGARDRIAEVASSMRVLGGDALRLVAVSGAWVASHPPRGPAEGGALAAIVAGVPVL